MGRGRSRETTDRRPVVLPEADAGPATWLRSIRLSGFTIAALTLIVLTVIVLAPSLRVLVEQRQEVAALEADVAAQQDAVDDLEAERDRWEDPSYIQSEARERLNYVYPGEYSFNVVDDAPAVATPDGMPISEDIQTTEVDWVSTLLSSYLGAGLGADAPAPAPQPQAPDGSTSNGSTSEGSAPDGSTPDEFDAPVSGGD